MAATVQEDGVTAAPGSREHADGIERIRDDIELRQGTDTESGLKEKGQEQEQEQQQQEDQPMAVPTEAMRKIWTKGPLIAVFIGLVHQAQARQACDRH